MKSLVLLRLPGIFLLTLLICFPSVSKDIDRAYKALQENDFTTAERLFNKILLDNNTDTGALFGLATVYAHPSFSHRNPHRALEYLQSAEKLFVHLREKDLIRLQKYGLTSGHIARLKTDLCTEIVQEAFARKSVADLETAATKFAAIPEVASRALSLRDELNFAETEKVGTHRAYQEFISAYPEARQVPEARKRYELLLYQSFSRIGTVVAYQQFLKENPDSPFRKQAEEQYQKLLYEEAVKKNTAEAFADFLRDNPSGTYATEAQRQLERYALRLPVRINGRWGYINGRGQVVIKPLYEKAGPFAEGLSRVALGGKWGYINDRGNTVIAPSFDRAFDFSEGLAVVMVKKKSKLPVKTKQTRTQYQAYFIDSTGIQAFDRVFETTGESMPVHSFSGGLAAVTDPATGKLGFINKRGDFVISPLFVPLAGGESASEFAFSGFSEGFAWVKDGTEEGLIDKKGVFLIRGKFTQPPDTLLGLAGYRQSFREGLCLVQDRQTSRTWYVDTSGKTAISLPPGSVGSHFRDGVAWVKLPVSARFHLIDQTGLLLAEVNASAVQPFTEGLAAVQTEAPSKRVLFYDETPEPTYIYMDKQGKGRFTQKFHILSGPGNSFLNGHFRNGIAGILLDSRQTYIDNTGKVIWQSSEPW
jgi:hypothetical protein